MTKLGMLLGMVGGAFITYFLLMHILTALVEGSLALLLSPFLLPL